MRTRKIFLLIALLCAVAQGAWAQNYDVWDGVTYTKPTASTIVERANWDRLGTIEINTAAELAWLMNHFEDEDDKISDKWYVCVACESNINLNADIDMTVGIWKKFSSYPTKALHKFDYDVTFNGNGHTIRIRIDNGTSDNYQGLFDEITEYGTVKNLHVECNIKVGNARNVAGIAGENDGTIENCWVSGHIESDHYSANDAELGGIAGLNNNGGTIKYCCVTADVKNTDGNFGVGGIAGSNEGTIQHVTFTGSVSVNHDQDNKYVGDQDATLENYYDSFNQSEYLDAKDYGMYRKGITSSFAANWPTEGEGTSGNPYIIANATDWDNFANNVTHGIPYRGDYVKLTDDISVSTMAGSSEDYSFQGTFDGDGKTLTLNVSNQARFAAPFKYVNGVTIKNLKTAGSISGTGNADGKLLAGIVGHCMGNTTITNCVSSMALTTDIGNDAAMAGLVAATRTGSLTISGCVFNGSMTGAANTRCAGIVGYEYLPTTTTITNSLFAPATLTVSTTDDGYTKTFSRDADATITNCYYTQTLGAAQGTEVTASDSYSPLSFGSLVQDYGIVKAYEHALLFDGKYYFDPATDTGTGTEDDPCTISNNDQWETFAAIVNNGTNNFKGKFVRLGADITVSETVGRRDGYPFSGTFLGGGHTITANISSTTTGTGANEQGVAPFHYISGATIRDLKVAGTIASASYHTSGLVGFAGGTNLIEGCVVTATINQNNNYAGGFIGHGLNSNTTIRGCVFAGTINGVGENRENIGAIWGWSYSIGDIMGWTIHSPVLLNCLELGTYTNIASMHPIGLQSGKGSITNCYYVNPQAGEPSNACTVSGATQAIASDPLNVGDLVEDCGTVKVFEHGILYDGTYYVDADLATVGTGTEDDPFLISSAEGWKVFVDYVNSGNTYSGKFVKLISDISVSDMAGTDDANSFRGTFDGDGKTLTFNKGTAESPFSEQYCAPFRHVKNATIRNLHVAGTIYTSAQKAAGFVGESHGALTIIGCRSSVAINSSKSGDGTHGGFVATLSGAGNIIIINGCVFDGSFATTAGTTNCGGFVGWPVYNRPTITNSLMKPSSVDAGMLINTFARWHTGYEPTITGCYYVAVDNMPTNQGLAPRIYETTPAQLAELVKDYGVLTAYQNGLLYGGKYYMAFVTLSLVDNADNSTAISTANGFIANVTLDGRTLYRDGAWNTLCLPFDVTLSDSPLDGATARYLTSASVSGSTLTLNFSDPVTTLYAGEPYIIKWDAASENIVSPAFTDVRIDSYNWNYDTDELNSDADDTNDVQTDQRVRFIGTYAPLPFTPGDKSILFMGSANTLYYPLDGASINAHRAYFKIGDDTSDPANAAAALIRAFNINFGDSEATGILSLTPDPSPKGEGSEYWYTLDGRRLAAQPSRAGVYIYKGIKRVIK